MGSAPDGSCLLRHPAALRFDTLVDTTTEQPAG
jgi:hypothetical protein